jgi:Bacterial regulatory proteins, tetR family
MQVFACILAFCENRIVTVFDPKRKRNARGEQRQQDILRAAAAVFGRLGYHVTTTNAIAMEAGVSPATLYQFSPIRKLLPARLPRCTHAKWPKRNGQSTPKAA